MHISYRMAGTKSNSRPPLKSIEYGVYGDLIILNPKPYSIYLRGAIPSDSCPQQASQEPGPQVWSLQRWIEGDARLLFRKAASAPGSRCSYCSLPRFLPASTWTARWHPCCILTYFAGILAAVVWLCCVSISCIMIFQ